MEVLGLTKNQVAVIFGGQSGEHPISLRSAASVMESLDKDKHEVFPVGITRGGTWIVGENAWQDLWEGNEGGNCYKTTLVTNPSNPGFLIWDEQNGEKKSFSYKNVDVVFPVLHGPLGEDGTIQGLLEMAGLPYVGAGVLSSSVGMDKILMKGILKQTGLPVCKYLDFRVDNWQKDKVYWIEEVENSIGYPCFIKPSNLGSSVGITKAYDKEQFIKGVEEALRYDDRILIETFVAGQEIECSLLGDLEIKASLPGEIIPSRDFYDYHAKYIDDHSELVVPAKLKNSLVQKIQNLSIEAFKAINGSGMARVDFFVNTEKEEIVLNEINTIPGFTSISMYPKLWEASGIPYKSLLDELIHIAFNKFKRRQNLSNSPPEWT